MGTVKAGLTRFREERSPSQAKLESIHYTLAHHLPSFCPCPKNLSKPELKSDGLSYWVEEIPRQLSIAVTQLPLTVLSMVRLRE